MNKKILDKINKLREFGYDDDDIINTLIDFVDTIDLNDDLKEFLKSEIDDNEDFIQSEFEEIK